MTLLGKDVSKFLRVVTILVDGVSVMNTYLFWIFLIWSPVIFLVVMYFSHSFVLETIITFGIIWLVLGLNAFLLKWFAFGFSERKKGRLALGGVVNILLACFFVWVGISESDVGSAAVIAQGFVSATLGIALLIVALSQTARQL
jgi:hypothetical protein